MRLSTAAISEPLLERRLGPLDAAAIIVSNVIGGGILFTPPQVAASVPSAMLFLATWAAGGLLAFAGAMAYAELAALRPRAGGEYVYLREAYGPMAAFLTGWTSFVAGFSGAIATSAVVFALYLGRFIPAAGSTTAFLTIPVIPNTAAARVSPPGGMWNFKPSTARSHEKYCGMRISTKAAIRVRSENSATLTVAMLSIRE